MAWIDKRRRSDGGVSARERAARRVAHMQIAFPNAEVGGYAHATVRRIGAAQPEGTSLQRSCLPTEVPCFAYRARGKVMTHGIRGCACRAYPAQHQRRHHTGSSGGRVLRSGRPPQPAKRCGCLPRSSAERVQRTGRGVTRTHDHRLHLVQAVPLLADLPAAAQDRVALTAVIRQYARDERVYGPGDRTGLFIVHSGLVKVHRLTESGGDQLIRLMFPGDFLGETALLADTVADHFAVALQPSELCMIDRDGFTRLLGHYHEIAVQMLQTVSARLSTTERLLSSIGGRSVGQRLAQQLLLLADEAGGTSFRLRTTKKELASYLGTSPETLSRRLGTLQQAGVIRLGQRGLVEVLDRQALQRSASG